MISSDSTEAREKLSSTQNLLREINRFQTEGEFKDFDLLMQKVGHFVARLHSAKQELLTILLAEQDISLKREIVALLGKIVQSVSDLEKGLCLIGKSGRLSGILATMEPISRLAHPKASGHKKKKHPILLCLPEPIRL